MIKRFAEHRVAANLLMVMMILAGIWAIRTMPSMLDPPANFPNVYVQVSWVGAAAEDIEALVTTPIEQQLRNLNDLKELRSRTINGFTNVVAIFNYDADIAEALDQVKQRVANIRNLPPDIEPPVVSREIDIEPISALLVTTEGSLQELIPMLRSFEKELLRRGVQGVRYTGMPTEEIALLFSGERLQQLGMTLNELAQEVARVSQNVPAGAVGRGHGTRQLRGLDQRRDPMEFEQLQLESGNQLIRIGDVAKVERRPQRGQPYLTSEGKPAVQMMLWRATDSDALLADELVKGWLDDVNGTLPAGVEIAEINNVWDLLGAQLDMISKNALSGLALVIVVLFLFLSARAGFWVTVGIPVSFMLGLCLFYSIFGYGISIIALIGFIMALGIVVDDAIVVGEDIVTHHENGATPLDAAVRGAQRMWVPVATSSLTTMAAFMPLLIIGGIMGDMVLALPTVLLCIIAASLVECFWVLPGHLRASLERVKPDNVGGRVAELRSRFDTAFKNFRDERFVPVLNKALDYPAATISAAVGGIIIAFALVASQHVGFNMVMGFDIESVEANVEFSSSASDAQKLDFVAHLEKTLTEVNATTDYRDVLGWTAAFNTAEFNEDNLQGEQYAAVNARYAYEEDRLISPNEFARLWRERIRRPAYVEQLTIGAEGGANAGQPDVTFVLRGNSIERLKQGAEELSDLLAGYPGVSNVTDNLPYGKEQIIFEMTPRGRSLGLTAESIGRQLRAAYSGSRVQIFNEEESELEVRVMLPDAERDSLGSLQRFPIRTESGAFVPLSSVAVLYNRRGIDVIRHSDTQLAIQVQADVDPEVNNALSIINDLSGQRMNAILDRYDLSFGLGGKSEHDQVIMSTMALGAVLTLILIYLILAWVFSSYLWPLAIMMAIPFGLTGAVVGHWVTGWDIGSMSMLAFFSLTGIVVNDSIVLISFLRRDVDKGTPLKEALTEAARSRFRAVVLTSLTTVAGLSPLMFETSSMSMYVAPIAVTVCFGLTFGTTLVLLVIPALILTLERTKDRVVSLKTRFIEQTHAIRSQRI